MQDFFPWAVLNIRTLICVPVYILCIYSCCALLLIKAVRSGMDAQSQTADADHRPTRFSVRPPARFGKGVDFTLWIQRVELHLKEARRKERSRVLEDESFRIVSQMGYLSDDAIDYTAVKKCLEKQFAPPGVEGRIGWIVSTPNNESHIACIKVLFASTALIINS